jgi:hypothetical protein
VIIEGWADWILGMVLLTSGFASSAAILVLNDLHEQGRLKLISKPESKEVRAEKE